MFSWRSARSGLLDLSNQWWPSRSSCLPVALLLPVSWHLYPEDFLALRTTFAIRLGSLLMRFNSRVKQSSTTSPTASTQAFLDLEILEFYFMSKAILASPFWLQAFDSSSVKMKCFPISMPSCPSSESLWVSLWTALLSPSPFVWSIFIVVRLLKKARSPIFSTKPPASINSCVILLFTKSLLRHLFRYVSASTTPSDQWKSVFLFP